MNMLKSLIIALAMYSKLPVPNIDWDEKNMRYAMCFFPVVGVIIGALVFGAGQLILRYTECGKLFFAAVMTMIPVAVTGGIHLDGFADTIDAVSSYKDREKKLEILKDPHTGAFAVIGLCAYFLITAALWSEVNLKNAVSCRMDVSDIESAERTFSRKFQISEKQRLVENISREGG